jgi:hypothetical protein
VGDCLVDHRRSHVTWGKVAASMKGWRHGGVEK